MLEIETSGDRDAETVLHYTPEGYIIGRKIPEGGILDWIITFYIIQGSTEYGKRVTDHDGSAGDRRGSL